MSGLLSDLGVPSSMIDSSAFSALDGASPLVGVYLTAAQIAADVVRTFEQSMNAQVYPRTDGVWTCRVFDPSIPATYTLTDADFMTWTPDIDLSSSLSTVRVQYDQRQASGVYAEAASSDDAIRYGNETSDTTALPTYLRTVEGGTSLAAHDQFWKGAAPCRITTQLRGLSLLTASVGDMVAITRARGPIARTGTLDGQLFEIVKLTKALAGANGVPAVSAVLEDLGGQTDRVGRMTDGTIPDWSTATAAQKAVYLWMADGNGYLDSTDLATRHAKVMI